MFRYRLHSPDGDDLGEATYAQMILPGEEIHRRPRGSASSTWSRSTRRTSRRSSGCYRSKPLNGQPLDRFSGVLRIRNETVAVSRGRWGCWHQENVMGQGHSGSTSRLVLDYDPAGGRLCLTHTDAQAATPHEQGRPAPPSAAHSAAPLSGSSNVRGRPRNLRRRLRRRVAR